MARQFNELVKEFNAIRTFGRDFYINGFKQREEFQEKSLRSYDNERRRIESYLSQYIEWEQTAQGKSLRLSLKEEQLATNPFFNLWQTKSFTKNDIFLHFVILDCLVSQETLTLSEITDLIHEDYLSRVEESLSFSDITVRNKLKEYCQLGILKEFEKEKRHYFQLVAPLELPEKMKPVLHFFKEVMPGGVIGQYILNEWEQNQHSPFTFKHHFIVHSLDEQVVLQSLEAIQRQRYLHVTQFNGVLREIAPLALYNSTETGRQYLIAFLDNSLIASIRIDNIKEVTLGTKIKDYDKLQQTFDARKDTSWNGSFNRQPLKSLRVLLQIHEGSEDYLMTRLAKEQRMGNSTRLDPKTVLFEIELIDLFAINPFLRTFIGRISSIESSDRRWESLFIRDMKEMIALYDLSAGGETL